MSGSLILAALHQRVHKKVAEVVPVVVGAVVLVGVLAVVLQLVVPILPEAYRPIVQQAQSGDWAAGRKSLLDMFDSYGPSKVYAFVAVQILQVLAAPVPGQVLGLLGGYLFGFWYGLALTMTGLALGSWIALSLGRFLGDYVVRKLVPQVVFARFDYLVEAGGFWNFFMLFLLPALPDDAIFLIAGLTRLSMWKLVIVGMLGRFPGMAVLTFVGASADGNMVLANVMLSIAMIGALIVWLYSEELEAYVHRLRKDRHPPSVV